MNAVAIIPARYASTRFPGKPLAPVAGRPMLCHVYERARASGAVSRVVVATDDERIHEVCTHHDMEVVLTRPDHASGTDRVHEAACLLGLPNDALIANIQGDEPALDPCMVDALLAPFADRSVQVSTLARCINAQTASSPDVVKVVFTKQGVAVYFSRAAIPYCRNGKGTALHGHIGLYAFRRHALDAFVHAGESELERTERLEQLRFYELGIPIHVRVTDAICHGVDRPEDIARAEALLASNPVHT